MKTLSSNQIRIYEAAVRLFAQRGTTHANVSELAHAAGVARGTIYNNVGNLDSLFEEVAAALADEMHARIDSSFQYYQRSRPSPCPRDRPVRPPRPRRTRLGPLYRSLRAHHRLA